MEQSSLKGNQSAKKSHLSLPKGREAEGKTLPGRTQLFPGLEGFKEAERQPGLRDTQQDPGFRRPLGDALL